MQHGAGLGGVSRLAKLFVVDGDDGVGGDNSLVCGHRQCGNGGSLGASQAFYQLKG